MLLDVNIQETDGGSVTVALPEWRLVETAPHDTYVLLGWWDEGKWNSTTGFASHGWRRGSISTMSWHGQATHWMPLPAPPPLSVGESAGRERYEKLEAAAVSMATRVIKVMTMVDREPPEVYVACSECAGEGHALHSRYGGNDPDVWSVRCEYCGGAGGFIREARGDKMIKQFVETPVTTWEPDDTTPRNCDCGFSANTCKTNNCQRKKLATSGLVPDAKWPDTGF